METPLSPTTEAPQLRVSIIVVSQNQLPLLRPTLAALALRNQPESSEVLVVDCGSRDGSARLDDEFPDITILRLPKNFGRTKAINIATRTAKGEFLLLLPNGVRLAPDAIDHLLAALTANPAAGAATPAGPCYALPKPGDTALTPAASDAAEYPHDQPVLFPKLSLVSMNYFRDSYGQHYADLDLFHKLRDAGKRLLVVPQATIERDQAPLDMIDADTLEADRLHGLGAYYGKHFGLAAGLSFWLRNLAATLFSFRFGLFAKLLGGTKVDGL
jgi:hypothetical protein